MTNLDPRFRDLYEYAVSAAVSYLEGKKDTGDFYTKLFLKLGKQMTKEIEGDKKK